MRLGDHKDHPTTGLFTLPKPHRFLRKWQFTGNTRRNVRNALANSIKIGQQIYLKIYMDRVLFLALAVRPLLRAKRAQYQHYLSVSPSKKF